MKPDTKNERLARILNDLRRNESSASTVAVGALLVVTILYAATMT
jgi:hypothetical protein